MKWGKHIEKKDNRENYEKPSGENGGKRKDVTRVGSFRESKIMKIWYEGENGQCQRGQLGEENLIQKTKVRQIDLS